MPEESVILEQIRRDGGVAGARARKTAQRAADVNPVKSENKQPGRNKDIPVGDWNSASALAKAKAQKEAQAKPAPRKRSSKSEE